jgi:hypothetical protein
MSPNVVGVGGTSLNVDNSANYVGETGWSGSGGGISAYESKPAFQNGVTLSATKRTSPDVAYNADPNTGFWVYDSYFGGGWGEYGGTSAGAPQWAALVALANQGRSTPLSSSGTLNAIYGLINGSTDLHDVLSGSSGTFSAGAGYDLVTGVGSPLANNLISYLHGVSANALTSGSGSGSAPGGAGHNVTISHPGDGGQDADGDVTSVGSVLAPPAAASSTAVILTVPVVAAPFATPAVQIANPLPAVVGPAAASLPALQSTNVASDRIVERAPALPASAELLEVQREVKLLAWTFLGTPRATLAVAADSSDARSTSADSSQQVVPDRLGGASPLRGTLEESSQASSERGLALDMVVPLAGLAFVLNGFRLDAEQEAEGPRKRPAPQR